MPYSFLTGIWKTIRNGVIFLGPSIIAFVLAMPEDVQLTHAPLIGAIIYFLNNFRKHYNME